MNRLLFKSAWPLMVLATFSASTLVSRAGDPIIFSNEKPKGDASKPEMGKEVPGSRETSKIWDNLPAADPRNLENMARPGLRNSRRKTKEEKELQREQDQKRNWLLLRPDQLREEQEQQDYVPFPDRDTQAEEGNDKHDYTFHGLDEPKGGREGARQDQRGVPHARNANLIRGGSEASSSGEGERAQPGKSGQNLGSQAAKELDLSELFSPNAGSRSTDVGKSDPIWRDVLGSGGSTRTREQQLERLDRLGSGLAADSKLSSELGRAPSTPSFPKSLDTPTRSGGNGVFGPNQDFGALSGQRSLVAPGLPDWNTQRSPTAPRGAPSGTGYNPLDQQPVNRPSVIRPTVLEIPQRKL